MNDSSINLDFVVRQGNFRLEIHEQIQSKALALVGPSGSGKTTVLDVIAGLRRPASGQIVVQGRTLFDSSSGTNVPPARRRIGYVPQDIALFPHLSVDGNIFYGTQKGTLVLSERVIELLEIQSLMGRPIDGLSGGERQRVALVRALMSGPDLLLLDEPLAAVDESLRDRILPYIDRVRVELGIPMIYVSHASKEVCRIADCVVALNSGSVVRVESVRPKVGRHVER